MAGRKKTLVAALFHDVVEKTGKMRKVKCNFCCVEMVKNGTRMARHIASCKKCDEQIKAKYLKTSSNSEAMDNIEVIRVNDDIDETEENNVSEHDATTSQGPQRNEDAVADVHQIHSQQPSVDSFFRSRSLTPISRAARAPTPIITSSPIIAMKKHYAEQSTDICKASIGSSFSLGKNKLDAYMDSMSDDQIRKIQLEIAEAIYGSGCPLSMVENKRWIKVFSSLRPSFKLPNRDMLSNSLLECVYQETATTAMELVAAAKSVAILCDGWSNIRNEGIINFVVTAPQPIFWSSIATGAESHTGQYMANAIKKVVQEVGPMKVIGICTDNATNMKKSWELIQHEFPHIQPYGCLAHTLHLVFTDINKIKSADAIQRDATNVVKAVKKSQKLTALLCQHQQKSVQQHHQSLKLPVKTRWGSTIHCMESIRSNKPFLQALAINEEAKPSLEPAIKALLLSEVFWDRLEGYIKLLKPVADAITTVEGDNKYLSIVMKVFSELYMTFENNLRTSPILKSEEAAVKAIIPKRKEFLVRKIHLAAAYLDPRYKGCHLTEDEKVEAMELITEIAEALPSVDDSKIYGELSDYRAEENLFSKPFVWKAAQQTTPTSWWKGICGSTQLSQVAARILSMPPTSAAVERSFSRHAWIHSAKRNRLTTERAGKLVYIAHNIELSDKGQAADFTDGHVKKLFSTRPAASGMLTDGASGSSSVITHKVSATTPFDSSDLSDESDDLFEHNESDADGHAAHATHESEQDVGQLDD